jgi:hypothetical protein
MPGPVPGIDVPTAAIFEKSRYLEKTWLAEQIRP